MSHKEYTDRSNCRRAALALIKSGTAPSTSFDVAKTAEGKFYVQFLDEQGNAIAGPAGERASAEVAELAQALPIEKPAPKAAPPKSEEKPMPKKKAKSSGEKKTKRAATAPRGKGEGPTGAKAKLIDMVSRPQGATMREMETALGWKRCNGTLSIACREAGIKLRKERNESTGNTRYFAERR